LRGGVVWVSKEAWRTDIGLPARLMRRDAKVASVGSRPGDYR
jgi:hypothetical protein